MTTIAATAIAFTLVLGVATIIREAGYEFDLRKRSGRRELGGRRVNDRA
jgi:hypothetical protein